MRRITTAAVGAALLIGGASVAPAAADTPGCASRHEFGRINKGMSVKQVKRIFDTRGELVSFSSGTAYFPRRAMRKYTTCQPGDWMVVHFQGGWVSSKTAVFS
jgi:hypothetical protein